jgi:atypical dual specificity phosphatase
MYFKESKDFIASGLEFSWIIPKKLAGMRMPGEISPVNEEVGFLHDKGITIIVNLTEDEYPYPEYSENFKLVEIPIIEFNIPTNEQIDQLIEMFQSMDETDAMAVHCRAGIGRTGIALACLLGKAEKLTGNDAMKRIRSIRSASFDNHLQSCFIYDYLATGT